MDWPHWVPVLAATSWIRLLRVVGEVEVAGAVEGDSSPGYSSSAEVAAPPSPVWPELPEELPATV